MKRLYIWLLVFFPTFIFAQKENESAAKEQAKREKLDKQSQVFAYEGYKAGKANKLPESEMDYRKAISKNPDNTAAQYNMGDVLYSQKAYGEAANHFRETAMNKKATKEEKHRAFHNLGNIAMEKEEYDQAVQFYKEALRNNPADDETRYNLAVAKDKLSKQKPKDNKNQQNKDNKDQQNKDNKDQQNKDNKDQQNKDNKDQQNKDNKDQQNKDNKDNKDQQNKNNKDNKDQNKDNKDNKDNQDNKNNNNGQGQPERQPSQPQDRDNQQNNENNGGNPEGRQQGELSPEQINRILNAISNEEKKTQEKINAKKIKGKASRTDRKDW